MERNVSSVVLEKTVESSVDCKKIQLVHPKGNQSWILLGSSDAEAETQYFGHLMQRADSFEKTLIWKAGKDWGQEEKGTTEDEMVGWHHWHSGHGFGWILGVGDGQGGLACCSSSGCKESDLTEWLNWTHSVVLRPAVWSSLVSISEMQIHAPLPELLNPNFLWLDTWNHFNQLSKGILKAH